MLCYTRCPWEGFWCGSPHRWSTRFVPVHSIRPVLAGKFEQKICWRMHTHTHHISIVYIVMFIYIYRYMYFMCIFIFRCILRKSKDKALSYGSRKSFTWIISKSIYFVWFWTSRVCVYIYIAAWESDSGKGWDQTKNLQIMIRIWVVASPKTCTYQLKSFHLAVALKSSAEFPLSFPPFF